MPTRHGGSSRTPARPACRAQRTITTRRRVCMSVMGMEPPQMQTYPRGRHSAKPGAFRAMIEGQYPTAPKIELFARGTPAPTWDVWGEDCTIAVEPDASA